MKYIKYLLFLIIMLIVSTNVQAATITDATYDGNFKVTGSGSGQVQIVIFDPTDSPIYMATTPVTNGVYAITVPQIDGLTTGNYKVKVADYDGTNVSEKTIYVEIAAINNPNTYDNILISFIIGIISILGITGYIVFKKVINK